MKTLDAVPGERWVLSSDGLDAVVSLSEIEQVMRSTDDLSEIADTLIAMTLERGAPDNVTVVSLQVIDREVLPVDEPVGPSSLPESALPDSIVAEQEVSTNTQKLPEVAATAEAAEAILGAHHDVLVTSLEPCCTVVLGRCVTISVRTITPWMRLLRTLRFCVASWVPARISWLVPLRWLLRPA